MRVRVASAGTGKTTSLVLRYLELIAAGTPLRRIAGVTFTNVAAAQLRDRVESAVRAVLRDGTFLDGVFTLDTSARPHFDAALRELDGVTLTTIHGFMIAGLRLTAPTMALHTDFTVLGEWEAQAMFEEELTSLLFLARSRSHGLEEAVDRLGDDVRELVMALFAKRSLTTTFVPDDDPKARAAVAVFDAAYARYVKRLGGDMLAPSEVERRAVTMMQTAGARERVVARHPVVLVDEFQDVNPVQGAFFEQLERAGSAVEVVGDPKQSIYGFRHADVEVFRRALRQGERLPPLTETRRHARVLTRFLNSLTDTLAERGMGFAPEEAPPVQAVGKRAGVPGRIELHWVTGERPIGTLRSHEAHVLAERLHGLHRDHGHAYSDMAVLARSYASLREAEEGLRAAGIPYVLLQGRGYYERQEIRDLVHALRVGVDPQGVSLAAWLRSPFAQLPVDDVERVVASDDPVAYLEAAHPQVADRLRRTSEVTRGRPLDALKFLIREPLIAGRRFVEFLDARARENVDALLFTVASRAPTDIAVLLEWLALLSRQAEAGDVPQSGAGVQLLTVHRSKGLEWPVVAVFDLGRMTFHGSEPLYLDPELVRVSLPGSPAFADARAASIARDEQETYRLLYVAASRPQEVLVLTGSVKGGARGAPEGWAIALAAMGLGPTAESYDREEFRLQVHPMAEAPAPVETTPPASGETEPAPWIDHRFPSHALPPVQSPSRYVGDTAPPRAVAPTTGEDAPLPGRGAAIGTLVHYAISRDWTPDDPAHIENLRAQEVMFPYTHDEREEVLAEVRELLASYRTMLGTTLPALAERADDRAELPFAMPVGATVWQGVIDRLYRTGDTWMIDDYKTDRVVEPERYHLQAGVYLRAVQAVLGVTPVVRLVYLRVGELVHLDAQDIERALASISGLVGGGHRVSSG